LLDQLHLYEHNILSLTNNNSEVQKADKSNIEQNLDSVENVPADGSVSDKPSSSRGNLSDELGNSFY
jgi:hypothetical protein